MAFVARWEDSEKLQLKGVAAVDVAQYVECLGRGTATLKEHVKNRLVAYKVDDRCCDTPDVYLDAPAVEPVSEWVRQRMDLRKEEVEFETLVDEVRKGANVRSAELGMKLERLTFEYLKRPHGSGLPAICLEDEEVRCACCVVDWS